MKKSNVLKSSLFHMDSGDKLSMLFLDEGGVPVTYSLNSIDPITGEDNIFTVPDAPTAISASDITSNSFTANWNYSENTLGFYLDVAKDSAFTLMVAGYNNLGVGLVNECPVAGLLGFAPYYYRLRGYNDYGTGANSNTVTLTTVMELVLDGDGNVYTYVTIGTQQWLVENLKTTKYINGNAIPNLTLAANWIIDVTGAYCWYDNDIINKPLYGALYNQYAVDNINGLTPVGWRVALETDFNTLFAYIGGGGIAGGKLKETGITRWTTPNTGATDDYGFKAVGGGYRVHTMGGFYSKGTLGWYWTSVSAGGGTSAIRGFSNSSISSFDFDIDDHTGVSVKCVRDV